MATYMKISGIDGDVTAKGHENWIHVDSLEFSTKRTLNTQPGRIADREGARPALSEITITKQMDKSSPLLFSESCVGKAKDEVKINLCTTGSEITPFMEYTLSNVIVSRYQIDSTSSGEASSHPREHISLSYDKVEMKFTPFDENNKPQSPIPAGYDLKQAAAI